MDNMTIANFGESKFIYSGDCEFEDGIFNNAGSGTLKKGCLLARDESGKFKKFTGTSDTPVAIYIGEDLTFANKDYSIRALIKGNVLSDKILVDEAPASAAQKDAAKANGLVPVKVQEMNKKDNQ